MSWSVIAIVPFLDAAGAAGNDAAAKPGKMRVAMRESAAGLSLSLPKHHACGARHEKLRIPPTARYFSDITAAGVRSNIFDSTLFYPHN
jgi:hypothetical protein